VVGEVCLAEALLGITTSDSCACRIIWEDCCPVASDKLRNHNPSSSPHHHQCCLLGLCRGSHTQATKGCLSVTCASLLTRCFCLQGILDNQTRHRRQKKLGEGEMPEIGEKDTTRPSGASQGRGKHLRVLSIKKL